MHIKIKENIDNAFQVLNSSKLTEQELVNVLASLVVIIAGEPFTNTINKLYKNFPALKQQPDVVGAISDITLLICGKHHLIRDAFHAEKSDNYLEYTLNLTNEIISELETKYDKYITHAQSEDNTQSEEDNSQNEYYITINEIGLPYINDKEILSELQLIGDGY
jgi:hypothetical protein